MRLELQLTGPGTSAVLHSLGVRLHSDWFWKPVARLKYQTDYVLIRKEQSNPTLKGLLHAYTIAELGEMIPWGFLQSAPVHKLPGGIWKIELRSGRSSSYANEVEARAHFLIDLINNKEVSVDEVNHPDRYNLPVKSKKNLRRGEEVISPGS